MGYGGQILGKIHPIYDIEKIPHIVKKNMFLVLSLIIVNLGYGKYC